MNVINNKNLYPLIDQMMHDATVQLSKTDEKITCGKGCTHCCHLLIEITWEEALELAHWIDSRSPKKKAFFINQVKENAQLAKALFSKNKRYARCAKPINEDEDIPEKLFDLYFDELKIPCPMLVNNKCAAYKHRPVPCRLHVVTTPAEFCSNEKKYLHKDTETPKLIEEIQEDLTPIITSLHRDPRYGHFGIMVEAALESLDEC